MVVMDLAHVMATMVVVMVAVVQETNFLPVNCVGAPITPFSSSPKGLIQHIWGQKRVQTLHHLLC
jgi:hypothetical protein